MDIVWQKEDGGIAITSLCIDGLNKKEYAQKLVEDGVVPSTYKLICTDVYISVDNMFGVDGLAWDGQELVLDKTKCVNLTKQRLRNERQPKLAQLDINYSRADAQGNLELKQQIEAQRQVLRDVTSQVTESLSFDELKALKVL